MTLHILYDIIYDIMFYDIVQNMIIDIICGIKYDNIKHNVNILYK